MLLFTCLLGFEQGYEPIDSQHHFDASISELALEFEAEESGHDNPLAPETQQVEDAQFVLLKTLLYAPFIRVTPPKNYITPLTRAPPLV